jgi:hypothetical protein
MRSLSELLLEVNWNPAGTDTIKTKVGKRMPSKMQERVDLLRKELKDNGIELGKITSGYRDAYNQGRVMYANWFDLPKNQLKSGQSESSLLDKRHRYLVKLYNDKKAKAVDKIFATAYKESNDGKGGISPKQLKKALDDVENYLEVNPISNHQGNRAIDVSPNSALKAFISSGKSKYAEKCLDEGNHLHIKLKKYDGSAEGTASYDDQKETTKEATKKANKIKTKKAKIKKVQSPEIKSVGGNIFTKIGSLFRNKRFVIAPDNISKDPNIIKKTVTMESINVVYSLSDILNEKFGDKLKKKVKDLARGKNKANILRNASITNTNVKPEVDVAANIKTAEEKPKMEITYNKTTNIIQLVPKNRSTANVIGFDPINVTNKAEASELAKDMGIENYDEIEAEKEKGNVTPESDVLQNHKHAEEKQKIYNKYKFKMKINPTKYWFNNNDEAMYIFTPIQHSIMGIGFNIKRVAKIGTPQLPDSAIISGFDPGSKTIKSSSGVLNDKKEETKSTILWKVENKPYPGWLKELYKRVDKINAEIDGTIEQSDKATNTEGGLSGTTQTVNVVSSYGIPTLSDSDRGGDAMYKKGAVLGKLLKKYLGLTTNMAAGIVGNLIAESGLYSDRIQGSGLKRGTLPQAGSGGYSYAQWTHSSWKKKLRAFAKSKGFDVENTPMTDDQAFGFLLHSLKGHKSISKMNKVHRNIAIGGEEQDGDIGVYTDQFLKLYEKPANQDESAWRKRARHAISVANMMDHNTKFGGTHLYNDTRNQTTMHRAYSNDLA